MLFPAFAPIDWTWKTVLGPEMNRFPCEIGTDKCKLKQEVVRTRWAHSRTAYYIQVVAEVDLLTFLMDFAPPEGTPEA